MASMEEISNYVQGLGHNGPLTLLLLVVLVLLRLILTRLILGNERLLGEVRRRWLIHTRNVLVLIFFIGLIFIWAPQLRTFTVTLVAVAAAIAIATKELISCLGGSILRLSTNAFTIGDRIEIAGVRGNVVDHNVLTTTVLEIGPGQTSHQYTGRGMIIPNSIFLTKALTNETYTRKYVLHITRVPLTTQDNWQTAEKILLEAAKAECKPYIKAAKHYMKQLEGRNWLDSPSVEPQVTLQFKEPGHLDLLLRLPCPPDRIARIEQAILRKFMSSFSFDSMNTPSTTSQARATKPSLC